MLARLQNMGVLALLLAAACSEQPRERDAERLDAERGPVATPPLGEHSRSAPDANSAEDEVSAPVPVQQAQEEAGSTDAGAPARDASETRPADRDAAPADAGVDAQQRDAGPRPPHSPSAVYSAQRYVGDTERVTITKRDRTKAHCLVLITAFPANDVDPSDVDLPAMWLTRFYAVAVEADGTCAVSSEASELQFSQTATGRLAWRDLGAHGQPCSADLDIEVSFMPSARIPARDTFLVEDLPIPCD